MGSRRARCVRTARVARAILGGGAMLAWGGYILRLLLRSLHMLQLENYQTLRFLRWSLAKPERWVRFDRALLAAAAAVVAATPTPAPAPPRRQAGGAVREPPLRPPSPTRGGV